MTYSIAQSALTLAATGVLYTAIAYTAAGIFHQIWKKPAPQPIQEIAEIEAPTPEPVPSIPIPAPIRSAALALPITQTRVKEEAPKLDTIRELRKRCTQAGIKGAGKWTKVQCLAALG